MSKTLQDLQSDFSFAQKYKMLISSITDSSIEISHCENPDPKILLEYARYLQPVLQSTDRTLYHREITHNQFTQLLTEHYEQNRSDTTKIVEDLGSNLDLQHMLESIPDTQDLLDAQDDAPIIKLLNALLSEAIKMLASDLHFETYENHFIVRFRIDGIMHEVFQPPKNLSTLIVSRIKVMAKLDIAEKRMPQDGRVTLKIGGRPIDVRVSIMPSSHGERVVLRLLDKQNTPISLDTLGACQRIRNEIKNNLNKAHGIILVTGPTGAGKTTTLYAALSHLNLPSRTILTVEDPIEYDLPGIGQTPVNTKIDLTFAKGLRAILRQDPDIIMVGEIRDRETAHIAIQASLTGHLVLSTLHTNTAMGAIVRLQDMGIPSFLLSSSLLCVIAQRLVRTLCPACKKAHPANEAQCIQLQCDPHHPPVLYHAVGCDACNQLGYKGRQGLYEIVTLDETLKAMIQNKKSDQTMEAYARTFSPSILQDGLQLVLAGITSLDEIVRVAT